MAPKPKVRYPLREGDNGSATEAEAVDTQAVDPSDATAAAAASPEAPLRPPWNPHFPLMQGPRLVGMVPIILDKPRHLRLDLNAIDKIEEQCGILLWQRGALQEIMGKPKNVAIAVWAGLLHEDPDITLDYVRTMPGMEISNLGHVADALWETFGMSLPDTIPGAGTQGPAGKPGDADPNPPAAG